MNIIKYFIILPLIFFYCMLCGCGTPPEFLKLESLAQDGKKYMANDFNAFDYKYINNIKGLAIINTVSFPYEKENKCNGYCLRALYNETASQVIIGNSMFPILPLLSDKKNLQERINISSKNIESHRSYELRKNMDCPKVEYKESYDFQGRDEAKKIYDYNVETNAARKIANGNCIFEITPNLSNVNLIFEISNETITIEEDKSHYDIISIRAYQLQDDGLFKPTFQKTIVETRLESAVLNSLVGMGGSDTELHKFSDNRYVPEILENELKINLQNFEAEIKDPKSLVQNILNRNTSLNNGEFVIFNEYFSKLQNQVELDEADKEIILKIIKDKKYSELLSRMSLIFNPENDYSSFVWEAVFQDYLDTSKKLNYSTQKKNNIDEADSNEITQRKYGLEHIIIKLPNAALIENKYKFIDALSNYSEAPIFELMKKTAIFPYDFIKPLFKKIINSKNRNASAVAIKQLCRYGGDASELKQAILTHYFAPQKIEREQDVSTLKTLVSIGAKDDLKKYNLTKVEASNLKMLVDRFENGEYICEE